MFAVKPEYIRRISFVSKIFPKINSVIGLDCSKIKSTDQFDGESFCRGRSKNKDLLTFFGLIKESSSLASFAQLPLFRRSLKKLTSLVELQLETIGANEILLPTLLTQKLWHDSERLKRQPAALEHVYKFTDNGDNKLLLGPTFEESITRLVSLFSTFESELPLLLYQSSSKFRYEPNPRFGLVRSNEFFMNDTYSFDANIEQAKQTYDIVTEVYKKIFKALGLDCIRIQSGTGDIGGKYSHEFQLPVSSGEDTIVECDSCRYSYNLEMNYESKVQTNTNICINCGSNIIRQTQALELGHTFLLSDIYSKPLKAKYTSLNGPSRNFEMGCYGLGLTRILAAGVDLSSIVPDSEADDTFLQIRWPNQVEPYKIGVVVPSKRSKQYNGGSTQFVEKVVTRILESTRNIDLLIEDRDKEGIFRRLVKLKSLGIPYIIVIGQRFLQEEPEVELLKLDSEKKSYEQFWFTEDQLYDYIVKLDK